MSYKIAVASSDGIQVDRSFGGTPDFRIYEVEGTDYKQTEIRSYTPPEDAGEAPASGNEGCGKGSGKGCGSGHGCGGPGGIAPKVDLISDVRAVIAAEVGFKVQKQLERLAISTFDIKIPVEDALQKIVKYYDHLDQHKIYRPKD